MKQLAIIALKVLALVVGSYGAVIGIAFSVRTWVVSEASAVADQKIEVVKEIRKTDMMHLDKRFDRLEKLIQGK